MQTLIQNRILDKRELKILDNKLTYYEKRFDTSGFEVSIAYEDLTNSKTIHSNSLVIFWTSMAVYCGSLFAFMVRHEKNADPYMWIYMVLIATATLIFFLLKREDSWKIRLANNGGFIYIHRNLPDSKTATDFLENLYKTRDEYLKETYMTLDKNLSYELQYKNLNWLKFVEAISKQEFEAKYDELKTMYSSEKRTIGFGA